MNGRRLIVLLLASLALVAAGCGGTTRVTLRVDTDTAVVEETTTEETTEETTSEDDRPPTTRTSRSPASAPSSRASGRRSLEAMGGGNAGLDEASELFDELASQVPDEIKADFEVIAENFAKLAEALEGRRSDVGCDTERGGSREAAGADGLTRLGRGAAGQRQHREVGEENC